MAVCSDTIGIVHLSRNRSKSEKTPPRVMIGFTDSARDGSENDSALTLPRTGSDSGSGGFFLDKQTDIFLSYFQRTERKKSLKGENTDDE